ncbi:H-NS histone family protein [Tropicimonas marinistellae]|uniref:H-NS histone family protein n=1 Tax=Tropicimonas marinistellae TaxID=1739787 RepID=UPI00082AB223|nr:H-NS histone family protein [Tropicimonas marinistellae]
MSIDLANMSRAELEQLAKDVEIAMVEVAERERREALEAIEETAKAHGYDLSDLSNLLGGRAAGRGKSKAKNPPKFRNPENPKQTWTGRGRKPAWIKDAEEAGKDLAEFAI